MRILRVGLLVAEEAERELTRFYRDELRLPALDDSGRLAFAAGATVLEFRRVAGSRPFYHFALRVPRNRFDAAHAWLAGHAGLLSEPGSRETTFRFESWNAEACYAHDPAGNIVELIARERAPGTDLFLEVSEVGLPVADVGVAVEFLESEVGLPHFSGNRRDFSAVGDDRGLFIVVPVGRPWLFTDRPAPDHPIAVTVAAERAAEVEVPGSRHVVRLASA